MTKKDWIVLIIFVVIFIIIGVIGRHVDSPRKHTKEEEQKARIFYGEPDK